MARCISRKDSVFTDLPDLYGGHEIYSISFASIGVDISEEINFVWITSVGGNNFSVSDFKGTSTAMNVSVLWGTYSMSETKDYIVHEIGGTLGVLPFSVSITPGNATPIGNKEWYHSMTEIYLRTGGLH